MQQVLAWSGARAGARRGMTGMGTVQRQEMHREEPLKDIWMLGREAPTCSTLCSHHNGTARPFATRAGRFYVPRVVKKSLDEKT